MAPYLSGGLLCPGRQTRRSKARARSPGNESALPSSKRAATIPPAAARLVSRERARSPVAETRDPYHILVSEVMLQQTQVDRVLPKYAEWLENTPRSRRSPRRPKTTPPRHGGRSATTSARAGFTPSPRVGRPGTAASCLSDAETLLSFKGIGATRRGPSQLAFGQRAAILDTNVARVLFRVFVGRGNPKAHAMRKRLWALSRRLLPRRHVFDFNQALMDFGATVCVARKPQCLICPMRRILRGLSVQSRQRTWLSARISSLPPSLNAAETFLVTRRLRGTHLEGLWEFPGGKCENGERGHEGCLARELRRGLGCNEGSSA